FLGVTSPHEYASLVFFAPYSFLAFSPSSYLSIFSTSRLIGCGWFFNECGGLLLSYYIHSLIFDESYGIISLKYPSNDMISRSSMKGYIHDDSVGMYTVLHSPFLFVSPQLICSMSLSI